jgi:hypothetical protein
MSILLFTGIIINSQNAKSKSLKTTYSLHPFWYIWSQLIVGGICMKQRKQIHKLRKKKVWIIAVNNDQTERTNKLNHIYSPAYVFGVLSWPCLIHSESNSSVLLAVMLTDGE